MFTDGGPPINSDNFVTFMKNQGKAESSGQAERIVRLVKEVLKKFLLDPEIRTLDFEEQIAYF